VRALVESYDVFVPTSVLLETEWVLRSNYKITGPKIFDALRAFLALLRTFAENEKAAHAALNWAGHGLRRRPAPRKVDRMRGLRELRPRPLPHRGEGAGADSAGSVRGERSKSNAGARTGIVLEVRRATIGRTTRRVDSGHL
jgi:hypothetical protein